MADTIRGLTDEQLADYEQRAEQAMLTALESVMNRIAEHLGATRTASALVAHLPGKHDQRTHGHGGGKDWRRSNDDAQATLAATAETPIVATTPLGGGWSGSVKIEEHEGGTLVRKDFPPSDAIRAPEKQADAEQLGSLVAHAMGIEAPAVHRAGPHSVIMEHVPGRTWAEQSPYTSAPARITDGREGRRIGLFDVLVANPDRNNGNWMTTEAQGGGRIVAIDHGLAFGGWSAGTSSPFAQHLINKSGTNWADSIDVSPGDIDILRSRLGSLRGDFEAAGRRDWHDDMMERLEALAPRAAGTESTLS